MKIDLGHVPWAWWNHLVDSVGEEQAHTMFEQALAEEFMARVKADAEEEAMRQVRGQTSRPPRGLFPTQTRRAEHAR